MFDTKQGYANVVDFGARPNSFLDDSDAFLSAIATGNSVFVPEGIYYVSKTLKFENQNFVGTGCFLTQIVSINTDKENPIIMAGRSCKITDMLLKYKEGILTGDEKQGERVAIWTCSDNWPLQRGSSVNNVRIEEVGTCFYLPMSYTGGGPFSVEHSNLELQHFSFRAIDYGSKHRIGNVFSNVFITSNKENVDSMIHLDGDECNVSMSQLVLLDTKCKTAAISLNNLKGFHISSIHIGMVCVTGQNHGLFELNNASGEIGAISFYYIPIIADDSSLIRLYNANFDLCVDSTKIIPTDQRLKIGDLHVCGINDPTISNENTGYNNMGLMVPYDRNFLFISRDSASSGNYYVTIENYAFYTFKNDNGIYEDFKCDDELICFNKKGEVLCGGSTAQRPHKRLCKYISQYFDTDLKRNLIWDGSEWL